MNSKELIKMAIENYKNKKRKNSWDDPKVITEITKKAGFSKNTIYGWQNGRLPKWDDLMVLLQICDVSFEFKCN